MPETDRTYLGAAALDALDALVARSRRLGADRAVANWGGGNTSAKVAGTDFRGRPVTVLWVKGSGSDLAGATRQAFSALNLEDVRAVYDREQLSDEEMVAYLAQCTLGPGFPRQSIETLMHAFLPFAHVDHTHPDAIIALCTAEHGPDHARRLFGDRAIWVDYHRPGFTLAKRVAQAVGDHPSAQAVLLARHGLLTWGETSEACEENTLSTIQAAEAFLQEQGKGRTAFGGVRWPGLPEERAGKLLNAWLPYLRGQLTVDGRPVVLSVDRSEAALAFAGGAQSAELSQIGAACPDHLVHTRRTPAFLDWDPASGEEALREATQRALEAYRSQYARYFRTYASAEETMDPPVPRVIVVPGLGVVTQGRDKRMADITRDLYQRAVAVLDRVTRFDRFLSLDEKDSFAVEYWPLERYKLTLLPPPRELEGRVAVITGGAGAIGAATAARLAAEGCHVVVADLDGSGAQEVARQVAQGLPEGRALGLEMDVTSEASVVEAFARVVRTFGGVDIVVSSAGLASAQPVDETPLEVWERGLAVLATGYFLVAREGARVMKRQGTGGAMVLVASKNSLATGSNIVVYGSAKAAELHMARLLAHELGPFGIRVNSVCPDAVLAGSKIWDSEWRAARSRDHGVPPEELDEFYRRRSLLGLAVRAQDVAEAIAYLASPRSSRTTGATLTVDAGIPAAFVR